MNSVLVINRESILAILARPFPHSRNKQFRHPQHSLIGYQIFSQVINRVRFLGARAHTPTQFFWEYSWGGFILAIKLIIYFTLYSLSIVSGHSSIFAASVDFKIRVQNLTLANNIILRHKSQNISRVLFTRVCVALRSSNVIIYFLK